MKRGRPRKPEKRKATFSLDAKTLDRIAELSERLGLDKGEVIDQAIDALADDGDGVRAMKKLDEVRRILLEN